MPSKKVQDFVGRNVGKPVEVTLTNGKVWNGVLEAHQKGFVVKTGKRGRPPIFAESDIKAIKHWKDPSAMPVAERGTNTAGAPQITRPINTTKESVPAPRQTRRQSVPRAATMDGEPTEADLAEAAALAEKLLSEPLSV